MGETNRTAMRVQWKMHKVIWNLSGGRLGRKVVGMPVLELVTIGRTSGLERQILITYVDFEGVPAIIGTNAGRDVDPAWVLNLRAHPGARARWNGAWHDVIAVELTGTDHEEGWDAAVAANAGYAAYAETLTRPIPIIHLIPGGTGR
jgi:deazaflavin-dependent oxidoreductase (nitroreductase family)